MGLGGLGHRGLKFAHALGAYVVLFTTSPGKTADTMRQGADELLKLDGTLTLAGAPEQPLVRDIEKIGIGQINDAYERPLKGDVNYRFVIDMASLKK